jgi:hypothetical protein
MGTLHPYRHVARRAGPGWRLRVAFGRVLRFSPNTIFCLCTSYYGHTAQLAQWVYPYHSPSSSPASSSAGRHKTSTNHSAVPSARTVRGIRSRTVSQNTIFAFVAAASASCTRSGGSGSIMSAPGKSGGAAREREGDGGGEDRQRWQ